jgi:2-dehydropantoate 2-reductase
VGVDNVCIVGGGAIGSIMAYYLYRGGAGDITVYYGSMESVEAVESGKGLIVTYNGVDYHVPVKPRHYTRPAGLCKYVVNTVKAYDVEKTVDLMKMITSSDSLILMLQNGFGSLELVEEKLGDRRVCGGVVFIGAYRRSRNHVVHHGGETVYAGCRRGFYDELYELQGILRRGGCDFRVVGDIDFYRWVKLAVNAVGNPLTAIARSKNKIVLTEEGRILARRIIEEVVEAARRKGYMLDPDRLYKLVVRSAENTSENYSSMAQDVLSGRRTEVDYINGYVAGILGEDSLNHYITLLIHLIEESYNI